MDATYGQIIELRDGPMRRKGGRAGLTWEFIAFNDAGMVLNQQAKVYLVSNEKNPSQNLKYRLVFKEQ